MSLYVEWLNQIKLKADINWLTKSQSIVYQALLINWQNQKFINLYGAHGSGKSFIARLLSIKNQYIYTTTIKDVPVGGKNIIIDDANYDRSMRIIAREQHFNRIIMITQSPVNEAMPKIELIVTDKDRDQFVTTLGKYCQIHFDNSIPEGSDLNQIMIRELKNRGEGINEH